MTTMRKIAASLFMCCLLIATVSLRADNAPKLASYLPAKLHLSIGCPIATVYTVDLEGEALQYVMDRDGEPPKSKIVKPSPQAWRKFWKALDRARLWQWSADYGSEGNDGTDWTIEIVRSGKVGKRVQSHGHNTYPDDRDLKRAGPYASSRRFKAYLDAVKDLLGGEAFR